MFRSGTLAAMAAAAVAIPIAYTQPWFCHQAGHADELAAGIIAEREQVTVLHATATTTRPQRSPDSRRNGLCPAGLSHNHLRQPRPYAR